MDEKTRERELRSLESISDNKNSEDYNKIVKHHQLAG
jgi:hypothetical protein